MRGNDRKEKKNRKREVGYIYRVTIYVAKRYHPFAP